VAPGLPVLNLPPGFKANSLQGGIVDNSWVAPRTAVPVPVFYHGRLAVGLLLTGKCRC